MPEGVKEGPASPSHEANLTSNGTTHEAVNFSEDEKKQCAMCGAVQLVRVENVKGGWYCLQCRRESVPAESSRNRILLMLSEAVLQGQDFNKIVGERAAKEDPETLWKELVAFNPKLAELRAKKQSGAEAETLLRDPALLRRVRHAIQRQGVAGEGPFGLTTYLSATSRLMPSPVSVNVKGDSSTGKNYNVDKVLNLLPAEDVKRFEALSNKALYYYEKEGLKHKVLAITEKEGAGGASTSVRWLNSEKKLRASTTVKDKETGEYKTKEFEIEGPVAIITTTTRSVLADDDESRNLEVNADASPAQTRRVLDLTAELWFGFKRITEDELNVFRGAQRILRDQGEKRVYIPFAKQIGAAFPSVVLHGRRHFNQFLSLVAAVAFLHQFQRKHHESGAILAEPRDYYYATRLASDFLRRTLKRLPVQSERLLEAAQENVRARAENPRLIESDPALLEFSRNDLSRWSGMKPDLLRKWVQPLEDRYFEIASGGGKGGTYSYRLLAEPMERLDLPDWKTLASVPSVQMCGSDGGIAEPVDPLEDTGENPQPNSPSVLSPSEPPNQLPTKPHGASEPSEPSLLTYSSEPKEAGR